MEQIISKDGSLTWNIIDQKKVEEPSGLKQMYFTVKCASCGYQRKGRKYDLRSRKTCPGCSKKPAAVKTDDTGLCVSICDIGTVEYVREYQEQHGVSEREAVRSFIETAKAHLSEEDPIKDTLTEESVRAKVRRNTGKKKDSKKPLSNMGQSAPNHEEPPIVKDNENAVSVDSDDGSYLESPWEHVSKQLKLAVNYLQESCNYDGNIDRNVVLDLIESIAYLKTVDERYLQGVKNGG